VCRVLKETGGHQKSGSGSEHEAAEDRVSETADNRFELGTDTFIVQNGKIVTQTFAGKISPKR